MNKINKVLLLCTFLCIGFTAQASTVTNFSTTMDGSQANAGSGTGSLGSGAGTMTLDTDTGTFMWTIAWEGLSSDVTVAHFHGPAPSGANGGVQVAIDITSNPTMGFAVLDAGQISDVLAGLWYVNIHTVSFPGGEIRGQVLAVAPVPLPAAVWLFASAIIGLGAIRKR